MERPAAKTDAGVSEPSPLGDTFVSWLPVFEISWPARCWGQDGIPVIHVLVGFRPGMPDVSRHNLAFSGAKQQRPADLSDPRPAITPEGSDVVVTKRRVSAFTGSDLEIVLRAGETDHLVLCGIATSGVVLSTLREAADKDYRCSVLADRCADTDAEVHAVLTGKVFSRQARVMNAVDWMAALG
jgi:nicotinamidase-related amidase